MIFFTFIIKLIDSLMARLYPSFYPPEAPTSPATPPPAPIEHVTASVPPVPISAPTALLWDTDKHSWHSVRVLCDNEGLSVEEKNLICACIYQESRFRNTAVGRNKDKNGNILSTDWGIVQINDYWNIGIGKPFPSVEYVVNHPEECVLWMIRCYKNKQLYLWTSYKSGAYKKWLLASSSMWLLRI
jgi:hypothetical protein